MKEFLSFFYLITIFIFVILGGLFSGIETAFVCTDYLKIKPLKKKEPRIYSYLEKFYWAPEYFLSLTLVGTNFCIVIASTLTTSVFIRGGLANASFWTTLILSPLLFLFAELIPKNVGRIFKERFLIYFLGLLRFLDYFRPLIKIVEFFPLWIIGLLFREKKAPVKLSFPWGSKKETLTKEDFKILTETLHSQGEIERLEKEAILDILGFSQTKVKDIYIRLGKVISFNYSATLEEILSIAERAGFTRYPVFRNTEPIGYLNIFDLFYNKSFRNWQELIRPILKVGINQDVGYVLKTLRFKKENIALVFKGKRPYGIITLQDIMREVISSLTKF